ncbi:MAG: hypothetical protein EXS60_00765 [Candidatus Pacebacteria bacterium]|nr:hypothetical protein [Candidatus Paceibacterota bacterium]
METASLKELLREHIEIKGLSPKKIADMTGIPDRYIEMLLQGDTSKLPPSPYVHGYIAKLSGILNFDKDTMWRLYQKESSLTKSGRNDRLPNNRFAVKGISRGWAVGGFVLVALVLFGGYNIYGIIASPELVITVPASDNSTVAQETILLQGKTDPAYVVTVNGSEVYVGKDGLFQKEIQLQEGVNTVEFAARKFLGKETRVLRNIVYVVPAKEADTPEVIPTNKKTDASKSSTSTGEGN